MCIGHSQNTIRKCGKSLVPYHVGSSKMAGVPSESLEMFDTMKVKELHTYLKSHGQLLSGRKSELIRRAKGTFHLSLRKTAQTVLCTDRDQTASSETERVLAENQRVERLADCVKVDEVASDSWPDFIDKEMYNYLVYSCKRTVDFKRRGARRQLKAHTFYEDRHVHLVRYHPVPETEHECYVKCCIIPSAASSDRKAYPDHRTWLRMSQITGQVHAAYCTCTAGLEGSCNHVAALMYALVDVTEHKQKGLDACTSAACKWMQPRKRRLSPKKAFSMATNKSPRTEGHSVINQARFAERLRSCAPKSGWLVNFSAAKEAQSPHQPATVTVSEMPTPDFRFSDTVDLKSSSCKAAFQAFKENLLFTVEDIWKTEQATKEQSKSEVWFKARAGRLTSSHFGDVIKRKPTTLPDNLLKTILDYRHFSNQHMKWGLLHEAAARRTYLKEMRKSHPPLHVNKCGLIIDAKMPYLASSPDGFVQCSHCNPSQGLLEVKCPSVNRNISPKEACSDSTFFCQLVEDTVKLKRNHNYYYQVQGQLAISGRKWCDFVVWTEKGMSIERIFFNEECWGAMAEKLSSFYVDAVLPEIFTERVKRGKSLFSQT